MAGSARSRGASRTLNIHDAEKLSPALLLKTMRAELEEMASRAGEVDEVDDNEAEEEEDDNNNGSRGQAEKDRSTSTREQLAPRPAMAQGKRDATATVKCDDEAGASALPLAS